MNLPKSVFGIISHTVESVSFKLFLSILTNSFSLLSFIPIYKFVLLELIYLIINLFVLYLSKNELPHLLLFHIYFYFNIL